MREAALRLRACGRRAVVARARRLEELTRAPAEHVSRHRAWLHQQLRELRASGRRGVAAGRRGTNSHAVVLSRKTASAAVDAKRARAGLAPTGADLDRVGAAAIARRSRDLERLRAVLAAHDPERALERGYALVEDPDGALVTSAAAAREAGRVSMRFRDDRVRARIEDDER
jgi:exodeoxyribonuclease VII large subunit